MLPSVLHPYVLGDPKVEEVFRRFLARQDTKPVLGLDPECFLRTLSESLDEITNNQRITCEALGGKLKQCSRKTTIPHVLGKRLTARRRSAP